MLSVRNAIISASLLFVMSLGFTVLNMMQSPDSEGYGTDSFGTRGLGYRGMFETLDELNIPVSRQFAPPIVEKLPEGSLVFLGPDPIIVGTEPTYLRDLQQWVQDGGRIVVAPSVAKRFMTQARLAQFKVPPQTVLQTLGLEGFEQSITFDTDSEAESDHRDRSLRRDAEEVASDFFEALNALAPTLQKISVTVTGDWDSIDGHVNELTIPGEGFNTFTPGAEPTGAILWTDGQAEPRVLAARFARGRGEIVVVSDPILFSNRLIAKSDNSVLAAYVLTPDGQPVTFDEFYHGLGVRGNPLYLLTRLSYAATTLGILVALGLWVWREAIFPGPPLPDETVRRRDIGEYIHAMARFFIEGGAGRNRLLQELKTGVLRQISIDSGLPPETGDIERIAAAVARKDPQRSTRLLETARAVDDALASGKTLSEKQTQDAMRRISACL